MDKLINDLEKDKIFNELDYIIPEKEILKAIKDLKNNKAAGFDTIINEMLKCGQSVLVKPLSKLFNIILSSGEYPSQWSKGYIHPIHKSGEKDNPSNYRGIVINSCIGKLFTKILNSRLNKFLAKRNVIPIEQIGFTKKKRTVDHMFILRSLVEQHTQKGSKPLYTCFIDFRKAFDSVWLQGLFYKMRQIGISDKFYKIVKEMY